jgi:hypothetical protein
VVTQAPVDFPLASSQDGFLVLNKIYSPKEHNRRNFDEEIVS